MSGLTATLSTIWLLEQEYLPTICAAPRPISSMTQATTARMTSALVLIRRLRRLFALPGRMLGTVTVSLDQATVRVASE